MYCICLLSSEWLKNASGYKSRQKLSEVLSCTQWHCQTQLSIICGKPLDARREMFPMLIFFPIIKQIYLSSSQRNMRMLRIQPLVPAQSNNHQDITDHSHTAIKLVTLITRWFAAWSAFSLKERGRICSASNQNQDCQIQTCSGITRQLEMVHTEKWSNIIQIWEVQKKIKIKRLKIIRRVFKAPIVPEQHGAKHSYADHPERHWH